MTHLLGLCELLHITAFAFSSVGQETQPRCTHARRRRHFLAGGRAVDAGQDKQRRGL
jgi:hypothetical protein